MWPATGDKTSIRMRPLRLRLAVWHGRGFTEGRPRHRAQGPPKVPYFQHDWRGVYHAAENNNQDPYRLPDSWMGRAKAKVNANLLLLNIRVRPRDISAAIGEGPGGETEGRGRQWRGLFFDGTYNRCRATFVLCSPIRGAGPAMWIRGASWKAVRKNILERGR